VYELTYLPAEAGIRGRPYLTSITPYGRCASAVNETNSGTDRDAWQLPFGHTGCAAFPPTTFEYTPEAHFTNDGLFEGDLFPREIHLPNCDHPVSSFLLSADHVAVADINRDGLPDIIQTAYPSNPVFLNDKDYQVDGTPLKCGTLDYTEPSPPATAEFSRTGGLTVPGYWGEDSAFSFVSRRGPPRSYQDGFPTALYSIRRDGTTPVGPRFVSAVRENGSGPTLPAPHLLGDLNNDGLVDAIYLTTDANHKPIPPDPADPSKRPVKVAFSTRAPPGTVARFSALAPSNLFLGVEGTSLWPPRYAALADMNVTGFSIMSRPTTRPPRTATSSTSRGEATARSVARISPVSATSASPPPSPPASTSTRARG
jgi:hypothetical protein